MAIIDKPSDFFNTVLYTGNGGTLTVSGVGFQSNFTWLKGRSFADYHVLTDSVRGVNSQLYANDVASQGSQTNGITSFNSDGFVLGNWSNTNKASNTHVGWNWKAGTSFTNDASATGIGSIDSAGSANQDAGFSICTYTNTNTNTIKHGLDVVPDVLIAKTRGVSGAWFLGSEKMLGGWNKKLNLNDTGAVATETRPFYPGSYAPTSSVFSSDQSVFGAGGSATETMIAYCFAEKQGYSKFGSYIGNGNADGSFIYTGFKPAWIMIKRAIGGTDNWVMFDNKRSPFNEVNENLAANTDSSTNTGIKIDMLSNGFKCRVAEGNTNVAGNTYIYMAFGQTLVGTNNIPNNAR